VRVASALGALPYVEQAFGDGRLSWDQVAALTRFVRPEDDERWAEDARGMSVARLEQVARRATVVSLDDERRAHRRRGVHFRRDERARLVRMSGVFTLDEGDVVRTALERVARDAPPDPRSGMYDHAGSIADAVVAVCSASLADDADADRATVVVFADEPVLCAGEGVGELASGSTLAAATVQRIACDARLQYVLRGADGRPVGVGRVLREPPPWLVRLVRRRDGGCRFPGCARQRWLKSHHIHHWAQGGPTDLDNLVSLCGTHHHAVHEGGWTVRGTPGVDLEFRKPNGWVHRPGPPDLRPEVRARITAA
jgi:hypothetical protein